MPGCVCGLPEGSRLGHEPRLHCECMPQPSSTVAECRAAGSPCSVLLGPWSEFQDPCTLYPFGDASGVKMTSSELTVGVTAAAALTRHRLGLIKMTTQDQGKRLLRCCTSVTRAKPMIHCRSYAADASGSDSGRCCLCPVATNVRVGPKETISHPTKAPPC
jgi:hypothetical protein